MSIEDAANIEMDLLHGEIESLRATLQEYAAGELALREILTNTRALLRGEMGEGYDVEIIDAALAIPSSEAALAVEDIVSCLEQALALRHFTWGGITERWAKRSLANYRRVMGGGK